MHIYRTLSLALLALSAGITTTTEARLPIVAHIEKEIEEQLHRAHENFSWLKLDIQAQEGNQKTTIRLSGLYELQKKDVIITRDMQELHLESYPVQIIEIHGWSGTIAFDNTEISFFMDSHGIQYKRYAKVKIGEAHVRIPLDLSFKFYYFKHSIDIDSLTIDGCSSTSLKLSADTAKPKKQWLKGNILLVP